MAKTPWLPEVTLSLNDFGVFKGIFKGKRAVSNTILYYSYVPIHNNWIKLALFVLYTSAYRQYPLSLVIPNSLSIVTIDALIKY